VAEFKIPELGENVTGGDVTRVMVGVGDVIAVEQPVLELETDKATVEVPSSVAGRVTEVRVKTGDRIMVGAVVLVTDDAAETAAPAKPPAGPATPEPAAPAPAAPAAPTPAPAAAAAREPAPARDPARPAPQKIVAMPPRPVEPVPSAPAQTAPRAAASAPAVPAAPGVRRLAREIGVEIDEVAGSGPDGRISEDDVKAHARNRLDGGGVKPRGTSKPAAIPLPDFTRWGAVDRQPLSNIRRTTAERLSHAWQTIPHVTQFDKADITAIEELRRKYREQVQQAGGNLTITALLVKVLAIAVRQFPQFNASLDPDAEQIVYKQYVHVGVAVDTDRGLLVPVVRDPDRKNITQIAIEVHQLAEKARARKLSLEEMSGGGITISNLGGIGGTAFTPIVNWPEVAILGVSRGIFEPVWHNNAFEPRQLLPLSLSYDHRVIDGADAMRFLRWVVDAIENPFLLSLVG
jgi:pyruvate dehydrogenase E2 component (dihydrolipoamide acetyltransferase)